MKVKVLIDIGEIPRSADDWELYTATMDCSAIAPLLTHALERAIEACASGDRGGHEALKEHFYPVARKYADWGACDTEPTEKAEAVIDKIQALTMGRRMR
jgi:hypothetical protein